MPRKHLWFDRDTIDMHESIKNLRRTQSDFATQNVLNGRH